MFLKYDCTHKITMALRLILHNKILRMKIYILVLAFFSFLLACDSSEKKSEPSSEPISTSEEKEKHENPSYDPNRGAGKFTHVELGDKLDHEMAKNGNSIYGVKCGSCHKLTAE